MRASNQIYDIPEGRPFWMTAPVRVAVTFVMLVLLAISALAVVITGGLAGDGELHGAAEAAAVVGLFGMHVLSGASVVYDCHACGSFQLRIASATCAPGEDKRASRGAPVSSPPRVLPIRKLLAASLRWRRVRSYCPFVLPVQIEIRATLPTRCGCPVVRVFITNDMLLRILSGE